MCKIGTLNLSICYQYSASFMCNVKNPTKPTTFHEKLTQIHHNIQSPSKNHPQKAQPY